MFTPRRLPKWLPLWLRRWWAARPPAASTDVQRARDLIDAIDEGGVPLNPARVNAIARGLGLEVSRQARMEETIARVRAALQRCDP